MPTAALRIHRRQPSPLQSAACRLAHLAFYVTCSVFRDEWIWLAINIANRHC